MQQTRRRTILFLQHDGVKVFSQFNKLKQATAIAFAQRYYATALFKKEQGTELSM